MMAPAEAQQKQPEREAQLSRDELITKHLPHVKRIVDRIAVHLPKSVDLDDLNNAGVIGLIEAAQRYDPSRDNSFITYAAFRIKGAVLSELRSRDFLSKANRRKAREIERAHFRLEQKWGREVKDDEVAQELGLDLNEYYNIKRLSSINFISFEEIGYTSRKEQESLIRYLVDGDTSDALTLLQLNQTEDTVAKSIGELPEKEALVLSLYYWEELTMKEIGKVLGITESRVSQIHSQAVGRLRRKLAGEGAIDV
ncbi:MAG: FliA/WhiG family RNA polymerase sigma factor [Thermodesulfobacteriota bacterium]|nr:FliA/WhiG family RNA polymerase sigma factor [Thermodesulfobacteriota bacterium]